jgi:hypothetical protein
VHASRGGRANYFFELFFFCFFVVFLPATLLFLTTRSVVRRAFERAPSQHRGHDHSYSARAASTRAFFSGLSISPLVL